MLVAWWQLHVQVFSIVEFAVQECTVEVEDLNIPIVPGSDSKYGAQGCESGNWGIRFVVVDAMYL